MKPARSHVPTHVPETPQPPAAFPDLKGEPSRVDLLALRKALRAYHADGPRRTVIWEALWAPDLLNRPKAFEKAFAAHQADEAATFRVVQEAFIHATRHVNSADRWPLVTERAVIWLLADAGLLEKPEWYRPIPPRRRTSSGGQA